MSRVLENNCSTEFKLGEIISFNHHGHRLTGRVVRVYNTRLIYHVEVDNQRYEVIVPDDDPQSE